MNSSFCLEFWCVGMDKLRHWRNGYQAVARMLAVRRYFLYIAIELGEPSMKQKQMIHWKSGRLQRLVIES